MDIADVSLRNATYARFVELGRAPAADDLAAVTGLPEQDVLAGWRRLHDAHALVLDETRSAIRMANPFSAVPTPHRVHAAGRWWYANCGWDAFGICAALHVDGRIETSCPDCAEPLTIQVVDGRPDEPALVFLCPLPAAEWWDDIGFT